MKTALPLVAALAFGSPIVAQESIVFTTEQYKNFAYLDVDGRKRGAGVDQVEAIAKIAGLPYSIEIMPWARAIALAETQPMHCVFAAARTPEREARFKWVTALYTDRNVLVSHSGSGIAVATVDEAKDHPVGTHRADYTESLLRKLGFTRLEISADFDTTLRKLLENRIALMPMSQSALRQLQAEGVALDEAVTLSLQPLGIACHLQVPDETVRKMQRALDGLIADGTQRTILASYGIDPPP
jgi:ABC-type amino acid transport/signal transduction systems, periplasmic component/domain